MTLSAEAQNQPIDGPPVPNGAPDVASVVDSPLATPIPFVRLNTSTIPVASRFEFFSDISRPLWEVKALTERHAVSADMKFWNLESLVFADCTFTNQSFIRDPNKLKEYDTALLMLEFYVEGNSHGLSHETTTQVDRHFMQLVDLSRPYRSVTDSANLIGVLIPHAAVGYDPSRQPPCRVLSTTSPMGRLLVDALSTLIARLPQVLQADAPDLADGFINLVRALLVSRNPDVDPAVIARARSLSMRIFIEQNIDDPDLGAARLCQVFNVSRRTLYRLFDGAGGVDLYIRTRRLHRCLRDLQQTPPSRGRVRMVGERWGFENPSHFNRLFKQHFGLIPSDCIDAAVAQITFEISPGLDPTHEQAPQAFQAWLRRHQSGAGIGGASEQGWHSRATKFGRSVVTESDGRTRTQETRTQDR